MIQSALPNIVEGAKGYNTMDINISIDDIKVYEPRFKNEEVT